MIMSLWITLCLAALGPAERQVVELRSPDGEVVVTFDTRDGTPGYSVAYRNQPVVIDSGLGLEIKGVPPRGFRIIDAMESRHDETWKPVYGERSEIRDRYHQLVVDLEDDQGLRMRLAFRAYDEGAAFCYTMPEQPGLQRVEIIGEKSEFRFGDDHRAWAVYTAQGRYEETRLSGVKAGCERPLTMEIDENTFLAVAEARLVDYARMKLNPSGNHALVSALSSPVKADLPMTTPWRVIMVAESPGRLLENNYLLLNLNDPCAIEDTSWIRPGKVIREVTLTTTGGKACVDFAAGHGLQYVEFDAGWYGHEYADDSDATTVTVDPKRSPGPLDLKEVIRYAEERGVGILLYVNRRALERQIDEVLPLFAQWGVKGVKYGFVQVGSQEWTAWLHEAVRKAAGHRLMVDVHDEYRPTGYSRTYPNLMTQEGIAGDETSPSSEQTLTILFTRMLAGAGDNTVCYYDPRVKCHAYQLAKAVCLYSPWQFLYWYDRPAASPRGKGSAGGSQNVIGDEPELTFFDHLPTVWDETKVIHGKIGRYAVIARRSGGDWYIGCMNGEEARTLAIPLDFLEEGKEYEAHAFRHDDVVETRTHVRIERFAVHAGTVLETVLAANGGEAVRIVEKPPVLEGEAGRLRVREGRVELLRGDEVLLSSPREGLWSIATGWRDDWRADWIHAHPGEAVLEHGWLVLTGKLETSVGTWELRDAYRPELKAIHCIRRFTWKGSAPAEQTTLSVRWQMPRHGRTQSLR
jgi:alpha-glucosidase